MPFEFSLVRYSGSAPTGDSDKLTLTDEQLALMRNAVEELLVRAIATCVPIYGDVYKQAMQAAFDAPSPPQVIVPRATPDAEVPFVKLENGSLLSIGDDGAVYLDAKRLGVAMVAKLVRVGNAVYGLGKTVPAWWQWNGTAWVAMTAFDANILK